MVFIKKFTCQMCGNEFESPANRASYCPECRKQRQRDSTKRYIDRLKNNDVRRIGEPQICIECGKPYILLSGSQKVCDACRKKHENKMKIKANSEHRAKTYDSCIVYVKKGGEKQRLIEYAKAKNISLNELFVTAVNEYITKHPI
ncbi:hypothetical protein [Ruminococcus sp. zg-921]|uniref:hypothetical protein n=1 Tax=Ruminococcus sp. zg-921 TaxID=2678506 RepID=UPI00210C5AA2|nr:hypothetical protein [Ruminococcus sp. zg-921]